MIRFFPKFHRCLLMAMMLLLCQGQVRAQHYKAIGLSLPEGLSQSTVYDIIQDKKGFTWIATQDGLNKYDGINFTIYREEPFDSLSISSNNIAALLCDSKGRIWVGSANHGLNLMIPGKEGFRHFFAGSTPNTLASNIITALHEDKNGNIWVGSGNGLHLIMEKSDGSFSFKRIPLKSEPQDTVTDKFVNVIYSDDRNQLWVGTFSGLFKLNALGAVNSKLATVWFSNKNRRISDNAIFDITQDKKGNIWIATRNGINVISYPGENITSFNTAFSSQTGMASNNVHALFCASSGDIWLGYNDKGIQYIPSHSVSSFHDSVLVFSSIITTAPSNVLKNGKAICFFEDEITKGIIWSGFNAGGAVRLIPVIKNFISDDLSASGFNSSFVTSILKDDDNNLWIGTSDGLLKFDRNTRKYTSYLPQMLAKDYNNENYINGLVKDAAGNIIFASGSHIFKVDRASKNQASEVVNIPDEIDGNFIRVLITDDNGNVYVLLRYGIYSYHSNDNTFTRVMTVQDQKKLQDRGYYLSYMYLDHLGNYWIGTSSGLEYYAHREGHDYPDFSKPVTYYHNPSDTNSLRNQNILYITSDQRNTILLGTMNGLTHVVQEKGHTRFLNYSTRNGLKNNVIYSIIPDNKTGHLWVSTNNGLTEFSPSGTAIATYDVYDGLQSNEFNSYASYKAGDGEFFFGGINGYTSFYPNQILRDISVPFVTISGISLPGNVHLNLEEMEQAKTIDLKYKENSFTIDFIGLHYVDPLRNQYAYKLEGFQQDWTYCGNSNKVNFSQLPPGKYTFKVKVANSDGFYNTVGDLLTINVKPPFYKTIWFYLLLAAFVAGVLWGLHKYRLSMKLAQIKEVEKIRRATAADFHDELGHKLTIITWFAEILKKKIGPDQTELRPHLDKIIETSGTLYHTMKDMLWAMDPDKDSVYDLYNQIREFGQELFDNTGVLFEAGDIPEDMREKIIPPSYKRHVLLIFKEVMHNSLKHAHSTNTNLELVRNENLISFRFKDNGSGFKMNGHNVGNGLNNVKRRAQMIHARIEIQSVGKGTVAELELPLQN